MYRVRCIHLRLAQFMRNKNNIYIFTRNSGKSDSQCFNSTEIGRCEMDRDSFRNKFIADDIKSAKKLKSKSLRCVFPCCNERAIQSHTISKEDALRSISKNGKVITFKSIIKGTTRIMEPTYIGINEATTFRGFCKKHDLLFERIDHGLYENEYDLVLQLLRCVGWWKSMETEKTKLINEHKKNNIIF